VFNRTKGKSDYWLYDGCNWNLKRSEYLPKRGPKEVLLREYHLSTNSTDGKFLKRYVSCLVHQDLKSGETTETGSYVLVRYLGNYDMEKYQRPMHGNTVEKHKTRTQRNTEELKRTHAHGATPKKMYHGSSKSDGFQFYFDFKSFSKFLKR